MGLIEARKKPLRKNHKFRFHLLSEWIVSNYPPQKAADVGGGKGLLAFLLNSKGWDVTVIDPVNQLLPKKFKDLNKNKTTLSDIDRAKIKRINKIYTEDLAKDYDILIGLHSHGSNIMIINGCKKYSKNFILLPCCVVDEPIEIKPGIDWFNSLANYAISKDIKVKFHELNFKGQNKIIYSIQ